MKVKFDLRTADGRESQAMSDIIKARSEQLGSTTKQSCVALAINILKSIRVDTKTANMNEKPNLSIKNSDSKYFPSWKRDGKHSRRVLRSSENGHEVKPESVMWKVSKWQSGESYHSYEVTDKVSNDKTIEFIIVCHSEDEARKHAIEMHKSRIKRGRNLARYVLGLAMSKIHSSETPSVGELTNEARKVGKENAKARINESGFNKGNVNIHVEDSLDYALNALRHGETYVQTAIQKSLNKMVGFIKHQVHKKGLKDNLSIPFEELKKNA